MAQEEQQIHIDDFTPDSAPTPDLSKYDKYKIDLSKYDKYKITEKPKSVSASPKPAKPEPPITGKDFGPGVPKPPLPWELRTDAQKKEIYRTKANLGPPVTPLTGRDGLHALENLIPVLGSATETGEGIYDTGTAKNLPQAAQGATKAIGGALDTLVPLSGESILAKPVEATIAGAAGWTTQEATQAVLRKLGVKPEYADLAGTLIGLLSGYAAGKIRLDPEQTTLVETLQGKKANTPEGKAKRIYELKTAATDPNRTQNERDVASAVLKRFHGIDQPAFKPEEPVKTKTPPVTKKTATPPVTTPVEGTKPLWKKPASLDKDVSASTPEPQTPAPVVSPEPVQSAPPTPVESTPEATPEVAPETPQSKEVTIWKKGDEVPDYSQVVNMNPHDLTPDPARFQYKQEAVGKKGTTDEFYDVKEWNPGLAGAMAVWQDPETGEVHPVNGHHRTEMAQRLNPEFVNVRFIPAKTAEEARTYGAFLNIGEGKGTALDAAKLFRDSKEKITPEDLEQYGIAPDSKLAAQGLGLSKLDPSIFTQVVNGKMTPTRGALIGDLLEGNYEAQKAAVDFFKQQDKSGTRYTNAEASDIIQSIKAAPEATEEIETLFGVDEIKKNLFGERGQVSAAIGKKLAKEKSLFGMVSKNAVAEKLSGAGNIINSEENDKISKEAAQVLAVYDKLKFSAGPVSDALNDAAKEVASGTDIDIATDKAYERIKKAVQSELSGKPATSAKPEPESATPAEPVQTPAPVESGEAYKGGPDSGVEDSKLETPEPVVDDKGGTEFEPEPESVQPESKSPIADEESLDLDIYKPGSIIHDTAWNEDLYIIQKMYMGNGKFEYQVTNAPIGKDGVPVQGFGEWWISPDERYILKPKESLEASTPVDPESEPSKPEPKSPAYHPSTTAPKGWDSTATPYLDQKPLSPAEIQESSSVSGGDWLENWFKPGNVIHSSYWQTYSKVLEYNQNPYGKWSVKVIDVDVDGNPVSGEKPRWHSTFPDPKDKLVKYDPILEKPVKPEPVPAPAAVLPKTGKTKEPPSVQGYKKAMSFPKKFTMNVPERKLIFGSTDANELIDKSVDAKVTVMNLLAPAIEHLPIPKSLNGLYFSGAGSASYTEHQNLVAGLVQAWAGTSADSNKNSLAIQIAAQKEFGSSSGWDFKANKADSYALNDAYDIYGKAGTILRTFLRAQYNETQKFFKDNGIKSVTAYRGMQFNNTQATPLKPAYGEAKYLKSAKSLLQPLSSFSLYPETAASFTSGKTGALIAAEIPVSRILSTPKTGMGCLYEYEILVMGGDESKNNIVGVSWNEFTPPNAYSSFLSSTQQIEMLRLMMGEIEANAGKPKPKLGKGSPKKPGN